MSVVWNLIRTKDRSSLQLINTLYFCIITSEMYVNEVQRGQCDPKAQPLVIKETPGTAFVDGQNGIGMASIVVIHCM